MSEAEQILCFSAGANAVFTGEKMLTTEAVGWDADKEMFNRYGLVPMKSFERGGFRETSWADLKQAAAVASEKATPVEATI
jgi:biotin synthase